MAEPGQASWKSGPGIHRSGTNKTASAMWRQGRISAPSERARYTEQSKFPIPDCLIGQLITNALHWEEGSHSGPQKPHSLSLLSAVSMDVPSLKPSGHLSHNFSFPHVWINQKKGHFYLRSFPSRTARGRGRSPRREAEGDYGLFQD